MKEDPLGNQTVNKKHRSEQGKLSLPDSKNCSLKTCIQSYLKEQGKPQKHSTSTISILEMELYYKDKSPPLTIRKGKLKLVGAIAEILSKEGLRDLGFDIPIESKVIA